MEKKHYELSILPLFEEDLNEIVDYTTYTLQNPPAAESLVSAVEEAIYTRLPFAESFERYYSSKERQYPYYRISVKNYSIFYVVIGNTMEVRRILYSRRDFKRHI